MSKEAPMPEPTDTPRADADDQPDCSKSALIPMDRSAYFREGTDLRRRANVNPVRVIALLLEGDQVVKAVVEFDEYRSSGLYPRIIETVPINDVVLR